MMLARVFAAALAIFVLTTGTATAAPVTLGPGSDPDVAVDANGVAHVVRNEFASDTTMYCRIARGAQGCGQQKTFGGAPGSSLVAGRPHVFLPGGDEVVVLRERNRPSSIRGDALVDISADGGATFGATQLIASRIPGEGRVDEAVFGPGRSITSISEVNTSGSFVQNAPLGGPEVTDTVDLGEMSGPAAIGLDGARPVAVYTDISTAAANRLLWRAYDGSGPINDVANWTAPVAIPVEDRTPDVALAGGPNGLFLLYERVVRGGEQLLVAKFTGGAFTAGVPIGDVTDITDVDLTQDAGGRLHAVWDDNATSSLRWSFSDDGVNWSPAASVNSGGDYSDLRVAAAADHGGVVTWESASNVVATALEALPGTGPGTKPPGSDTTKPNVTNLSIDDSTLKPGQKAKFTFVSSEAGVAGLVLAKRARGLKLKSKGTLRCLVETKSRLRKLRSSLAKKAKGKKLARAVRARRCKAFKTIGQIRQSATAGRNEIRFSGRIAGRKLAPGSYRAALTVTDAAGNVSGARTVSFRVTAKRKRARR